MNRPADSPQQSAQTGSQPASAAQPAETSQPASRPLGQIIWDNLFRKPPVEPSVATLLRQAFFFEGLDDRELSLLAKVAYLRQYHDGEVIFAQGSPSAGMYVIRHGAVDILLELGAGEEPLVRLAPPAFFGEMGLLDEEPRSATAVARGETELIGVFRPELYGLMRRNPAFGLKIALALARTLAVRLRETNLHLRSHLVGP